MLIIRVINDIKLLIMNKKRKQLSLDKIKIAKLSNAKNIIGGYRYATQNILNCNTDNICIQTIDCSTKTAILGYTALCL